MFNMYLRMIDPTDEYFSNRFKSSCFSSLFEASLLWRQFENLQGLG